MRVLNEHISDMDYNGHNISPREALANFLRVSPKAIAEPSIGEPQRYYVGWGEYGKLNGIKEQSWYVYGSYEEAENDVRSWAADYCEGAADDDYWYHAGHEKNENGDFDWDEIVDDIIRNNGIEWFLSSYDGTCEELPDGYVGFRAD